MADEQTPQTGTPGGETPPATNMTTPPAQSAENTTAASTPPASEQTPAASEPTPPATQQSSVPAPGPTTPGNPELSFGQKAVGYNFNPGGNEDVRRTKQLHAMVIDDLNNQRNLTDNPDKKRMLSIAITDLQTAQMWAVKAITWEN